MSIYQFYIIVIIFKHFVITVETLFILHVVNFDMYTNTSIFDFIFV